MKFLLTGGGDFEHFKKADQLFNSFLSDGDTIQILPYASDEEDFEEILERVEDTYASRNDIKFLMEKKISNLTQEMFLDAKGIYLEGGNTFDLITAVRNSNIETFFKALPKDSDKVFYADSAGAIILGNSVKTAFLGDDADEDEKRLQDYRGLDLLHSWTIHAHYTVEDDDNVMNIVYDQGMPVLALLEETGIYISESKELEVLTDSALAIFTAAGKQMVERGQKVMLTDFY